MDKLYYEAYEERYRAVQSVSADILWGHTPEDAELRQYLSAWTGKHGLHGRRVVEFCCGEGGSGVVLSELGCMYQGYDLAPSAVRKAQALLEKFPDASVEVRDLAKDALPSCSYDAAFDSMGLHMLVTDSDRKAYLRNMFVCLKPGAPAFFFHQSYREDAYSGPVNTFGEWKAITGTDYETLQERSIGDTGKTVLIPLVPARARNREDYIAEMEEAGFIVDEFIEMGENRKCAFSASLFVHRPVEGENRP